MMDLGVANGTHIVLRILDEIKTDIFLESIKTMLDRHEVLNTAIEISNGNLYLVCRPKLPPIFEEIIIQGETTEQREKEAMRIANDLVWKRYDLDSGPLYRMFLIKISMNDCILGVGLHHSIGDGLSIGTFLGEIGLLYSLCLTKNPTSLPPVRFQYMDYLTSMETWLKSFTGIEYIKYWVNHLKSVPETHLLPSNKLPLIRPNLGPASQESISFNPDVAQGLKALAAHLKTTAFSLLLASYKVAIWKMTGQGEVAIVVARSKRDNADLQAMIGNFATEFVYKTSLEGNLSFKEIVEHLTQTMINAEAYQPVPLEFVRRQLEREGINFTAPIIDYMPGMERPQTDSRPPQIRFPPPPRSNDFPGPYGIRLRDSLNGIDGSIMYREDLYEKSTIHSFLDHFHKIVTTVINAPETKLHDL